MASFTFKNTIRLAVLDDHPLVRLALNYGLVAEKNISVVGLYANCKEAVPALEAREIDLLILDYLLGDDELDGLKLIKQLRSCYPGLKIIVFSALESPAVVQLIMKAGVQGFVGKSHEHDTLLKAIRTVGRGKTFLTDDMAVSLGYAAAPGEKEDDIHHGESVENTSVPQRLHTLTERELEVVRCFLAGMSVTQIADKFSRSRKTISGQKQSALRKLGLHSDLELFSCRDTFS